MYKSTEKHKQYQRDYMKKWRKEHPQAERNQQKKDGILYRERHPEKAKEQITKAVSNWRKNNPEKNRAHRVVFSAKRNGTLIQQPCFCGNPKTEAHHKDYSKPLQVEWLCKIHHSLADKLYGK